MGMQNRPRTPSFRLDERRALVSGGSSGIGFAAACALAEAGAHVVLSARNETSLQDASESILTAGFHAEPAILDVTDLAAQEQFFNEQAPFDIVVNAAGAARAKTAFEMSPDDYDAVMEANTRGAYFLARNAAKGMIGRGGGTIIQISSQMGHVGGQDRTVYCASKHALEGMTKAMAIEWGPERIRVNTICPTFIRTPLTAKTFADPERVAWINSKIKLPRVGEVEDIMGAVLLLASDAGSLITGTSILVDGGWTAG